ncbi:hypothetical protein ABPG75_008298 [Micractinium tetrahymenae]
MEGEDSGGSARAVASDSEGRLPSLSEGQLPSDDEQDDVDMHGPDDENGAGGGGGGAGPAAASPLAGAAGLRSGGGSAGSITGQEDFLTKFLPHLNTLMHSDTQGVDFKALTTALASANSIYGYMIREAQPETSDGIFLMYSSFFQPLIREVLPGVLQQMLNDERQVQLCALQNAEDHRQACKLCIQLCAKFLQLHVGVLQGRELVPTINQRVADDLAPLLRTLSTMFDISVLVYSPAFQSALPEACWDDVGIGSWAAPPVPQATAAAKAAAAQQQAAAAEARAGGSGEGGGEGAGAGSGSAAADIDLTADDSPQAVSPRQMAASRWQAAFVDCFGAAGGWEVLLQLLSQPERLGQHLWAFLTPLAYAALLLLPARRVALLQPAAAAVQLVRGGLEAAPDLSALEGGARNSEARVAQVLQLARSILSAVLSPEQAEAQVGPLQREHVLRLLRAPAFTRQLAGVKQLRDLLFHTFFRDCVPASIEGLTAWLQQNGVVQQVLKSNLHQAQFAEQAQRVLSMLLQQGHLSEDSIAFLWQLTEDATTFEGVKTNAYGILASLGPHMEGAQRKQLFERLQQRAAASGVAEATSICQLLVGMAQQDTQARMWRDVVGCLLSIQLRPNVPPEVAGSQAVVEVCATYDSLLGAGATPCSQHAARMCIAHLDSDTAVPSAVVLHTLLSHIWHKPERMRAIMQQINANADLLRRCLNTYSSWLKRQRAALQAAVHDVASAAASPTAAAAAAFKPAAAMLQAAALGAASKLLVEGVPDGAFSHRAAVDAWMQLLHKVITKGNYFLLQEQIECMARWAAQDAVCEYDSQQAWDLAAKMVANGRKEVQKDVAGLFLTECLCRLEPSRLTRAAWRCFLAYLSALSEPKWDAELTDDDVIPANAYVSLDNQEAVRSFLWRAALQTPDAAMAQTALHHLAFINGCQLRGLLREHPQFWQQMVKEEADTRLEQLQQLALFPGGSAAASPAGEALAAGEGAAACGQGAGQLGWYAPPPALAALAAGGLRSPQELVAVQQCHRILHYLTLLLEQCQGRRMPCPTAHRSGYQGFELTINVQLPAQQGQKPLKQELRLPSNLPVGELRRTVADWLGKPPQFVRLLGGGREFESDGATLAASRAGQQLLMASLSAKPNSFSGRNVAAEQAATVVSTALVEKGEVYRLALALAQPPPDAAAATTPLSNGAASAAGGSRLVVAALQLLLALPTCSEAQAQLTQLLCQPDGGHQLRSVLAGVGQPEAATDPTAAAAGAAAEPAAAQPAVLMYAVQTLCTLLFPQMASQPAADPAQQAEAAAQQAASARMLQRRLLLSGSLQVLLELAAEAAAVPQGGGSSSSSSSSSGPAADAAVASATHAAMLLLLHRTQEAIDRQQMDAAAAAAELAAAEEEQQAGAGPAAGQAAAGPASASEPSSMQLDGSGSAAAGDDGGSSAAEPAAAAAGMVAERAVAGSAAGPSPSVSMAAAASLDVEAGTAGASSGAAPAERQAGAAGAASEAAAAAAKDAEEVEAAAAALAALAPQVARYVLRMLCSTLGCQPGAPAGAQPAAPAVPADVEALPLLELCRQALLLLKHLAQHSSVAVAVVTGAEAAAAEAAVRCLLLHPASAQLRQLAADWLPGFAGAAPAAHRWAFEHIVQPLLLSAGSSAGGGGGGAVEAGAAQEQMALCKHFIATLEHSEFPVARQLLDTLLRRLLGAIQAMEPIDGIASVMGALIRRLDCREVGTSSGLVSQLITACCFPALTALLSRETAMLFRIQAASEAQKTAAAAAAGSSDAGGDPPAAASAAAEAAEQQQQQQQQQQQLQAQAVAMTAGAEAEAERCIAAVRLHGAGHGSAGRASREAAFDLLLALVTHDSGCWHQAQDLLQNRVHHMAAQVLPQPFGNVPLQNLRAPGAFAGLQNGGATCYMSSVFQQLFMQPTIRRLILSGPGVPPEEQADSLFHQMQSMFAHLALGVEPWFEPRGFWRAFKDYDGQPVNIREHQDAYEFFTRLQDAVDEHLKSQNCPRAIHAALGGTFAQLITVVEAPQYRSERDEEFYQISLDVRGKRTLAESLRSFVCKELMDGQNQYHSEELGKKVDAEKRTLIKELPHTLVLHLKRFEWDYETYQRWKVKDRFEFPQQLDMYPYTVEGADEADGREPAGRKPPSHYRYELRGVVVHSGSAFAGHYYSYIKDRGPGGGWYCFDDTCVDPWDPCQLDKDCFGGRFIPEGFTQECDRPNSAYMLFYERAEPEPVVAPAAAAVAAAPPAGSAAQPAQQAAAAEAQQAPGAAEGEDTPMPTPEPPQAGMLGPAATSGAASAAAGTAGAAGGGQEGEGGVQPMALSPAPSSDDRAAGQQPAAAAGTGGGEQPPAQQQGGGTAGAQQQLAAAPAGAYGMPRELYETILCSNLRQLSQMQLLSMEYCRFMWNLSARLEEAVRAGTARKAAKREPTSSPGAMELSAASASASGGGGGNGGRECLLAALTSRRGGDLHAVIADVALLCLDYFLRIALRGGMELRKEVVGTPGRKGTVGMQESLLDAASKVPAAAQALLLHMSSGPSGMAASALLIQHGWGSVRGSVSAALVNALDCASRQEGRTEEVVHAVQALVNHLCTHTAQLALQSPTVYAEELMAVLARLASTKHPWRRAMLDPHLPTLLALIKKVAEQWASLDPEQRQVQDGAHAMLCLLSLLLRRFSSAVSAEAPMDRSRRKPARQQGGGETVMFPRNPHSLDGFEPAAMPPEVLDWLYADPSFPRKLLMPGALHGTAPVRLLSFLTWNNQAQLQLWTTTLLQHLLHDATDWRDLVVEVPLLTAVLSLKDGMYHARLMSFLCGVDQDPPGILKEMMNSRRGSGCQQILLGLALTLLLEAPAEFALGLVEGEPRWPAWARKFIEKLEARTFEDDDDDNLCPDSPTHEELASEADPGTAEQLSARMLRERYEALLAKLQEVWGSDTGSERSSSSGGSPSPRGGGGGGAGPAGGDWQAGLLQYGEAGAGPGGGSSQRDAAGPGAQGAAPQRRPGDSAGGASGGFVRAAEQDELPQQHISAGMGFGGEAEDQEAEVIEIHSDQE